MAGVTAERFALSGVGDTCKRHPHLPQSATGTARSVCSGHALWNAVCVNRSLTALIPPCASSPGCSAASCSRSLPFENCGQSQVHCCPGCSLPHRASLPSCHPLTSPEFGVAPSPRRRGGADVRLKCGPSAHAALRALMVSHVRWRRSVAHQLSDDAQSRRTRSLDSDTPCGCVGRDA